MLRCRSAERRWTRWKLCSADVYSRDSLDWIALRCACCQLSRPSQLTRCGGAPLHRGANSTRLIRLAALNRLTCPSPPVGKDARTLTSSVLFLTMSRVDSVRLWLESAGALASGSWGYGPGGGVQPQLSVGPTAVMFIGRMEHRRQDALPEFELSSSSTVVRRQRLPPSHTSAHPATSLRSSALAVTHSDVRTLGPSAAVPSLSMRRWMPWTLLWILKIWIETASFTRVNSGSPSGVSYDRSRQLATSLAQRSRWPMESVASPQIARPKHMKRFHAALVVLRSSCPIPVPPPSRRIESEPSPSRHCPLTSHAAAR